MRAKKTRSKEKTPTRKRVANPRLGQWLRKTRLAKRIGLREFSVLVGLSPTYVCHIEQGKHASPADRHLRRFSEFLGLPFPALQLMAGRLPPEIRSAVVADPIAAAKSLLSAVEAK